MARYRLTGIVGALWGLAGVSMLLGSAVYRLAPIALEGLRLELQWQHWLFLLFVLGFMAYAEGYRAFQQGFSPRVAARARYLADRPNLVHTIFAPLFCMAYFHAPRRRMITSLSVTAGIIVLIILVRLLSQPWRGIVDAGVVVGLAWGLVALLIFTVKAFTTDQFNYSPEVPESSRQESR
jgi:hypothetical protein